MILRQLMNELNALLEGHLDVSEETPVKDGSLLLDSVFVDYDDDNEAFIYLKFK